MTPAYAGLSPAVRYTAESAAAVFLIALEAGTPVARIEQEAARFYTTIADDLCAALGVEAAKEAVGEVYRIVDEKLRAALQARLATTPAAGRA